MSKLREAAQDLFDKIDERGASPLDWPEYDALRAALAEPEPTIKESIIDQREPTCVARIEVLGKSWRLDYLSLPVGMHELYAHTYTYSAAPKVAESEPTGERAYWIKELRSAYIDITLHQTEANRIADMLEADAP
jgi:hypothetical protein